MHLAWLGSPLIWHREASGVAFAKAVHGKYQQTHAIVTRAAASTLGQWGKQEEMEDRVKHPGYLGRVAKCTKWQVYIPSEQ